MTQAVDLRGDADIGELHEVNPVSTTRFYDNVDGAWVNLPHVMGEVRLKDARGRIVGRRAFDQYLGIMVYKCSACTFTGHRSGMVAQHVAKMAADGQSHRTARMEAAGDGRERCTACMTTWSRPGRGILHLAHIKQSAPAHTGATEQYIRRYSLEPSGPVAATPVRAAVAAGPSGTEEARSQAGRKRKRHRRHNRGGQ